MSANREEELTWREEAFATREERVKISMKALAEVSAQPDAVCAKAEATQKEYLDKMEVHTTHTKHSLSLDKMLAGWGRRLSSMEGSGT
jgi:hypothetical protein